MFCHFVSIVEEEKNVYLITYPKAPFTPMIYTKTEGKESKDKQPVSSWFLHL